MQGRSNGKSVQNRINIAIIVALCVFTALLDFIDIPYSKNQFYNRLIAKIVQQSCGALAGILILRRMGIRLFEKPKNLLYLIPCFIIAIDNFQFFAYFNGKMQLVHNQPIDFMLFFGYCICIGLFEEVIFRGILFSVLADCFGEDRKGFIKTFVVSSLIFGVAHLFNGFSFGTILQVGYSILTGGLFAFCLIKTKNILCCAFVHGVYNFCGLLFDGVQGLGSGVVFDLGTVLTMVIVSVSVGAFVLYKVYHYSDVEREDLYTRLNATKQ